MRRSVAVWLLVAAFCVSYAAPLNAWLAIRNARGMSCCPTSKATSCCKRTHAPGWVATKSGCSGGCCLSLGTAPVMDADLGSRPRFLHHAAAARIELARVEPQLSSPYFAFLFERPPPSLL